MYLQWITLLPVKVKNVSFQEQRIVPTGMAVRDNEIEQRRNFSESIFREWLPADSVWLGMMEAQRGISAVPVYVTRFGDQREQYLIFSDWTER